MTSVAVRLVALLGLVVWTMGTAQSGVGTPLPLPTFHHIHLNSVDPDRAIRWYTQYWPKGKSTTLGEFPAFVDEKGFYLLYSKVAKQALGAFDRTAQRSVPQSAFWTFGSTFGGADSSALRARLGRLDAKAFALVTLYGGADGKQTADHALGLPVGDQLATATTIKQQQAQREKEGRPAPTSGLDFGYLVDPDGMLVEITAGKADDFREHTHFWGEKPLCSANWHVEHLGATFPPTQNSFSTTFKFEGGRWSPCDVPTGEITYPTYMRQGQLRIPAGNARVANASWLWYPRQCRDGRCGGGNDVPLARSRGQVVDHVGLSYPSLEPVIAHLKAANIRILEGPYKFAGTRALLIEDPDGLAFELIEAGK
jgi:catechol 2,3-dioxygenase-like lactoylglutathione lyase family enzyme